MKTLFIFLVAIFLYSGISAQSVQASCRLVYSEDLESMISADASAFSCKEITVASIPPSTHTLTAFVIDFAEKGEYTFKKDPALVLPENYKIYFEDNLTGQIFDLLIMDSFSFRVNRSIPKRFSMRIEKTAKLYAKGSQ